MDGKEMIQWRWSGFCGFTSWRFASVAAVSGEVLVVVDVVVRGVCK